MHRSTDQDALAFPGRAPALLATLGLHLLLVLAWLAGPAPGVVREAPQRESALMLVQPPATPPPRPRAAVPAPQPRTRLPALATLPLAAPDALPPAPAQAVEAAPPATESPSPPAAAAPSPQPGDLLAASKRMAGGIDRSLRNGASPITAEPERKWERFAAAFAAARTGVGRDTVLESYTAADGVAIYRKTVGNRVRCYLSGSVGGLGPADGHSAGSVACPAGASWTRH